MNTDFEPNLDDDAPMHLEPPEDDPAAHLDGFRAPEIDGEEIEADAPVPVGEDGEPLAGFEDAPERMSRAAFCALWETSFNLPAMMLPDLKPLAITSEKKPASDEAANAAYDLIEMHFPNLLLGSNDTFGAIARMLPFLLMQAGAVRAILLERRAARAKPTQPEAANDDRAPEFKSAREGRDYTPPPGARSPADWMDAEAA